MHTYERRAFPVVGEFRAQRASSGDGVVLVGHAAVFNASTEIAGFTEEVAPGAFRDSIRTDDIRALFNHDPNLLLGRNRSGTLRLREDSRGLLVEIDPPDTQLGRDLLVLMKRGDLSGMSFGFQTLEDVWSTKDGVPHRKLTKVRLFDVSPVTFPAYAQTDVGPSGRDLAEELAERDRRLRVVELMEKVHPAPSAEEMCLLDLDIAVADAHLMLEAKR